MPKHGKPSYQFVIKESEPPKHRHRFAGLVDAILKLKPGSKLALFLSGVTCAAEVGGPLNKLRKRGVKVMTHKDADGLHIWRVT